MSRNQHKRIQMLSQMLSTRYRTASCAIWILSSSPMVQGAVICKPNNQNCLKVDYLPAPYRNLILFASAVIFVLIVTFFICMRFCHGKARRSSSSSSNSLKRLSLSSTTKLSRNDSTTSSNTVNSTAKVDPETAYPERAQVNTHGYQGSQAVFGAANAAFGEDAVYAGVNPNRRWSAGGVTTKRRSVIAYVGSNTFGPSTYTTYRSRAPELPPRYSDGSVTRGPSMPNPHPPPLLRPKPPSLSRPQPQQPEMVFAPDNVIRFTQAQQGDVQLHRPPMHPSLRRAQKMEAE